MRGLTRLHVCPKQRALWCFTALVWHILVLTTAFARFSCRTRLRLLRLWKVQRYALTIMDFYAFATQVRFQLLDLSLVWIKQKMIICNVSQQKNNLFIFYIEIHTHKYRRIMRTLIASTPPCKHTHRVNIIWTLLYRSINELLIFEASNTRRHFLTELKQYIYLWAVCFQETRPHMQRLY